MKPLKCDHSEEYRCEFCRNCGQCDHTYIERADGWWVKCLRTFKWHKCLGPRRFKS